MKIFPLTLVPNDTRIDFLKLRHVWVTMFLVLFVTTGIGTSILPVRFGVPPEISVLQIYSD